MKITRHENFNLSFYRKVLKEKFLFILIYIIKEEAKIKFVLSMYRNMTGLI